MSCQTNRIMMETRQKRPDAAHRSRCDLLEVPASNRTSKKIRIVEQHKPVPMPCQQNSPPSSCFFRAIDDDDLHGDTLTIDSPNPSLVATKMEVPLDQRTQCGAILFVDATTAPHLISRRLGTNDAKKPTNLTVPDCV